MPPVSAEVSTVVSMGVLVSTGTASTGGMAAGTGPGVEAVIGGIGVAVVVFVVGVGVGVAFVVVVAVGAGVMVGVGVGDAFVVVPKIVAVTCVVGGFGTVARRNACSTKRNSFVNICIL